jgi:hypothetical protein
MLIKLLYPLPRMCPDLALSICSTYNTKAQSFSFGPHPKAERGHGVAQAPIGIIRQFVWGPSQGGSRGSGRGLVRPLGKLT